METGSQPLGAPNRSLTDGSASTEELGATPGINRSQLCLPLKPGDLRQAFGVVVDGFHRQEKPRLEEETGRRARRACPAMAQVRQMVPRTLDKQCRPALLQLGRLRLDCDGLWMSD